jgi:ADP-ribose pyrophosphatase YjhB (NUDIX family)
VKFCSECGHPVRVAVPEGDDRPRALCDRCQRIFYENPKLVVGCLPRWRDQVLLCKRSIEPRLGYWTLPSGFMENGETIEQGALRETEEEAGARVSIIRLFSAFSLPFVDQVYLLFLADLQDLDFRAGAETEETRLFRKDEVPWDRLAFRAIEFALERYFAGDVDRDTTVHVGNYDRERDGGGWTLHGDD